jgi:hypothetical protein
VTSPSSWLKQMQRARVYKVSAISTS